MRPLKLSLAILVARGVLRFVNQGLTVEVETSGRKSTPVISMEGSIPEDILGLVGEGFAMQTLGTVVRDEAPVARNMGSPWLERVLSD